MAEIREPGRQPLRFGSFELDPQSGELRKAGVIVGLQDQSLKVLVELLERPGALVTRERLRQRLWPDGTFVDFDHGLNAVINRLRETLGDSADLPRFIQTVPRRGYRFIAPVEGGVEEPAEAPVAPTSRRKTRTRMWMALGVASLVVVAATIALVRRAPWLDTALPVSARVVQLTTQTGLEFDPTFSPDGTQIVYSRMPKGCPSPSSWSPGPWQSEDCGPQSEHIGLWQTVVGSTEARQLTTGPGLDVNARFSPDGRQVAFVRGEDALGRRRILLVSAVGGPATKLSDFPAADAAITWSADGKAIIVGRDPWMIPAAIEACTCFPLEEEHHGPSREPHRRWFTSIPL
jgi:DNA-binding winged helix-turn-helix (wHTH) protein